MEIEQAKNLGKSVLIEMDFNSKLGPEFIPKDPHKMSANGETVDSVVDKARAVLSTLAMIDGGCTRLNGKFIMILLTGQQKLLMIKNKKKEISEKDWKAAMMELTKARLQAARMISPFSIKVE